MVEGPVPADGALLAVKPDVAEAVLRTLAALGITRVLSIVAGCLVGPAWRPPSGSGAVVVRAMPNTPALVGAGVAAMSGGSAATADDLDWAEGILGSVGTVVRLPERHLDAVTGVSGSGPAYVFLVAEAMIEAGVTAGLTREVSRTLVVGTVLGSARMMAETGEEPAELRAAVTSPGGTTAAALRTLEFKAVRRRSSKRWRRPPSAPASWDVTGRGERWGRPGLTRGGAGGGERRSDDAGRLLPLRLRHGRRVRRRGPCRAPPPGAPGAGHRPVPPDPALRRVRGRRPCWSAAPPTWAPGWCWPWSTPGWAPPAGPWRCGQRGRVSGPTGPAWLVGPDNGLLTGAAALLGGAEPGRRPPVGPGEGTARPDGGTDRPGPTFDGRDVFAPAAAHLAHGGDPAQLGPDVDPRHAGRRRPADLEVTPAGPAPGRTR